MKEVPYAEYLNSLKKASNVEAVAEVLRGFVRDQLKVKHCYTFPEMKVAIMRKHVSPEIKQTFSTLAAQLENMEFRPTQPTSSELRSIKEEMKKVILSYQPLPPVEKPKSTWYTRFFQFKKGIQREVFRQNLKKGLSEDEELAEMRKFLASSKASGVSLAKARKELKEMGFPQRKIDQL